MKKHLSLLLTVFCFCYLNSSQAQNFNQFDTDNGYIRLGPKSGNSFAQIETNKSIFYFNRAIQINSGRIGSYSNQNFSLRTGNNTRMTIKGSNGFVGIGTTNPEEKLELYNGWMVIGGQHKKFIIGTSYWNSNAHKLTFAPKNDGEWDWSKSMSFHDDGSLTLNGDLRVFANASVHGNFTVFNILRVNETIFAKEIRVQLPPFPDYVFSSDYELTSLQDLEIFINKNGHLPKLPSAEEVEENGMGVGELQILQMEKIEELTLYVIQLKKEIEELKVK